MAAMERLVLAGAESISAGVGAGVELALVGEAVGVPVGALVGLGVVWTAAGATVTATLEAV